MKEDSAASIAEQAVAQVADVPDGQSAEQPPAQPASVQPPVAQQTRAHEEQAFQPPAVPTGRASTLQATVALINSAIPPGVPEPDNIPNAPPAEPVAPAEQNLAAPGTTVAEIPVAEAQTPAAEAAPAVEGGELPPTPEPQEISIKLDQWEALMAKGEADALEGVSSPVPATAQPEPGEQAPVQPAVETPQPQAAVQQQRPPMTPEQLAEIVTDPAKFEEFLDARTLREQVEFTQRVNEQVTNDMAVYMDNVSTMNEIYAQHPELKRYPHQTGRALIAARAANPNAQMYDLVKQISADMDFIVQVEQKVRANKETVDVRPKGPGQFVNNGPARAGAALPTQAEGKPMDKTQQVFAEILEASAAPRRGLRPQPQQ